MKKTTITICLASLLLLGNTLALGFMMSKGESVFGNATWTSLSDVFGPKADEMRPGVSCAADFDADGDMDFAYFRNNDDASSFEIVVFWGDGTGHFPSYTIQALDIQDIMPPNSNMIYIYDVAVGDSNGDGWPDIVIPVYGTQQWSGDYGILVLLNQGNGSFACATDINDDGTTDVVDLLEVVSEWGPCE